MKKLLLLLLLSLGLTTISSAGYLDDWTNTSFVAGSHKWGLCPPSGTFHAPEDYKKELKIYFKNI
jgi:hypothetical protein